MLELDSTGQLPYGMTVSFLKGLAEYAYRRAGGRNKAEVSVSWVDDRVMRRLNWRHRGRRGVTDVLSFAYDDIPDEWPEAGDFTPDRMLGEIVICLPQVRRQSRKIGRRISEEASLMVVHGLLHLMGFDHLTPKQEKEMFGLQQEILFERKIIYYS